MDRIKIGDRFVPLENSSRYGPREWTLSVADDGKRTWTEVALTESQEAVARLKSTIWWCHHPTWERTPPITQADIDKHHLPANLLDGCAVFPAPMHYPTGRGPDAESARIATEKLWMAHYADMEAKQTIIRPPEKPAEITHRYHPELRRGD